MDDETGTVAYDSVDEFAMDLLEDFDDELDAKQQAQLNQYRDLLWKTLAYLTEGVPDREDLTDQQVESMWKGLRSCLMLRNSIRKVVMDARGQPVPSPEELAEMVKNIKPKQETVH